MVRAGDATGEYPGLSYRNDADLKAWLAKRPTEAALEPELPIIDPHHHLWETPQRGRYFLPDLLADIGGGHNIVATVFLECQAMYRKQGPAEMAPVGEVEFVNGVAAMSASGNYGACRVAEAIIGHADLTLGARVRDVLEAQIAVGGGRFRGIRYGVSWDASPSDQQVRLPRGAAAPGARCEISRGICAARETRAELRILAVSSATAGCGRPRTCLPGHDDHPEPCRRRTWGRPLCRPPAGDSRGWKQDIAELAKCPNVNVKLGGIGMTSFGFDFHERDMPPSSEELAAAWRQYVEPCIEAFGPARCMFESNFPPDKQSGGYTELWNAFKRITAGASASEKTGALQRHGGTGVPPGRTLTATWLPPLSEAGGAR